MKPIEAIKTKQTSNAFKQLEETLKKRECEIVFCEIDGEVGMI